MTASKKTIKAVEDSAKAAVKTTEKTTSVSTDQIAAVSKASADAFKNYEDILSYSTETFDAVVKAGNIMMKGVQDFTKAWSTFAEVSVEKNAAVAKQLLACKSVEEAVTVQSDFAHASYDTAIEEGRKLADMGVKLSETASEPLKSRMDETVANFSKVLAA